MSSSKHSLHLAAPLNQIEQFVRSYVVMPTPQAKAVTLWIAHTHVLDAFETTPFLGVTSPEKQCGKSRLFDVLNLVAARPWRTIMPSEAVLYRKIDAVSPTLLLDEADAIFDRSNGSTEPLRALLNAGNRRGTSIPRCVGPTMEIKDFAVFCAKALAGIGDYMPDTVRDRSVVLRLERKRRDEHVRRFRYREALEAAEAIQRELASWAQDAVPDLASARPEIPDALDDRAEEAWEPLIAIADLAGGHWPEHARLAALELSASPEAEDDALGPMLLRDIRGVFESKGTDRITSSELAARLNELEESPWGDIRGKPLDARALARRLKRFSIRPRTIKLHDGTTARGYRLQDFSDAFARYLRDPIRNSVTPTEPSEFAPTTNRNPVTDEAPRRHAWLSQGYGVTVREPVTGGQVTTDDPSPTVGDSDVDDSDELPDWMKGRPDPIEQTSTEVIECVVCGEPFTMGEKGSSVLTCPACVASRRRDAAS